MDVDVDGFAVMAAAAAASDVGISYESKSESESELILSPSPVATFNSHSPMSGDELTSMLSLDLTSSTLALEEEDDAADSAADADGLPMIPKPKRRRNAGGHAAPAVNTFTSSSSRHRWSSLSFVEHLALGWENNSECRCSRVVC